MPLEEAVQEQCEVLFGKVLQYISVWSAVAK
jgi:hypothetical protein